MVSNAVHETRDFFDCEFRVDDGSQQRFWCGPYDPDPTVVQVGAVKLRLDKNFDIQAAFHELIVPVNRAGDLQNISQAFSDLTGLSQEKVEREGIKLDQALNRFESFSGGAPIFPWGKDELKLIAISCFVSKHKTQQLFLSKICFSPLEYPVLQYVK